MPPTVIPPSPDVNMNPVSRTSERVSDIVSKINQGKEVTTLDIELLKTELDELQLNERQNFQSYVPYVDRKFIKTCPSNPQMVCRYVGFVQDVLEPEYYVSLVNGGKTHTKYRDLYYHENEVEDEISNMNYLQERQPFLLVPVPASSKWFRRSSDSDSNHSEVFYPSHGISNNSEDKVLLMKDRKRSAEDKNDLNNSEDKVSKQSRSTPQTLNESLSTIGKGNLESDGQPTDWWPQGHLGSDPEECPLLAKVYENQDDTKMKLNSLVEVFGILDLDPLGASFLEEQQNEISRDEDAFFHDLIDPIFLPPPSLLPRIHVLYYKSLDLDEMTFQHQQKLLQTNHLPRNKKCDSSEISSERDYVMSALTKTFGGDIVLAESIFLVLLSIAERDPRDANKAVKLPCESTLGAASLNIILPDSSACQKMSEVLSKLLSELSPVFTNINLTLDDLNIASSTSCAVATPAKCELGRMNTSVLQLPKGACVLINQGNLTTGSVSEYGQRILSSLGKLTKSHSIPYRFQGLYEIDFEADFRCIVLSIGSTISGSKLLPCALRLKLDSNDLSLPSLSDKEIFRIRHYISRCRDTEQSSISLSPKLLEKAKEDFVERRQRFKGSDGRSKIEEDDFHRWLTLTRLQARSRLKNVATVEDWKNAILLDEKMSTFEQ